MAWTWHCCVLHCYSSSPTDVSSLSFFFHHFTSNPIFFVFPWIFSCSLSRFLLAFTAALFLARAWARCQASFIFLPFLSCLPLGWRIFLFLFLSIAVTTDDEEHASGGKSCCSLFPWRAFFESRLVDCTFSPRRKRCELPRVERSLACACVWCVSLLPPSPTCSFCCTALSSPFGLLRYPALLPILHCVFWFGCPLQSLTNKGTEKERGWRGEEGWKDKQGRESVCAISRAAQVI